MNATVAIRVAVPEVDDTGVLRYRADLVTASTLAGYRYADADLRLQTGRTVGTLRQWGAELARGVDRVLLVSTGANQSACELLLAALPCPGEVVTTAQLAPALTQQLGLVPQPPTSPYRARVLTAADSTLTGVDGSHAASLAADLTWIAGRARQLATPPAQGALSIPVHGTPTDPASWSVDGTHHAVATGTHAAVCRMVPVLPAQELTVPLAEALARAGIAQVRLTCRLGGERELTAALSAAARTPLGVTCQLDLTGQEHHPVPATAARVAALVAVAPELEVSVSPSGARDLASVGALRDTLPRSALARRLRAQVRHSSAARRRLVAGRYGDVPLVAGPHDLWWAHTDDPSRHLAWLAATVPSGGHLHPAAEHDLSRWTAPLPVSGVEPIHPYSDLPESAQASLAFIQTPRCQETFIADARRAWERGEVLPRFLSSAVGGLCRVGGVECWVASGRRLYVDACGDIRTGPEGRRLGSIGDPFRQIRREARRPTEDGACCGPAWSPGRCREPWLDRVLAAREAWRMAAPRARSNGDDMRRPADGSGTPAPVMAASGFGSALLHSREPAPLWPTDLALVQVGGRYLACAPRNGTIAELNRSTAMVLELCLDLGPSAAAVLGETTGTQLSGNDVMSLTSRMVARVTGSLMTPRTVESQVHHAR